LLVRPSEMTGRHEGIGYPAKRIACDAVVHLK
jgi:hypothetical protein